MNQEQEIFIDKIIDNLFFISPSVTKSLVNFFRAKTNLNPVSFYILRLLNRHEILSMSEIGYKLQMPKPHVTAQVDRLITENMVERLFDSNDRRIINIKMTVKGNEVLKMISQEVSRELRIRIQSLDSQKIRNMMDASQQLRDFLFEIMNVPQ